MNKKERRERADAETRTSVKREREEEEDTEVSERLVLVRIMRRDAVEVQRIDRQLNDELQRLVRLTETFLLTTNDSLSGTSGSDCVHRITASETTALILAREKLAKSKRLREEVARFVQQ